MNNLMNYEILTFLSKKSQDLGDRKFEFDNLLEVRRVGMIEVIVGKHAKKEGRIHTNVFQRWKERAASRNRPCVVCWKEKNGKRPKGGNERARMNLCPDAHTFASPRRPRLFAWSPRLVRCLVFSLWNFVVARKKEPEKCDARVQHFAKV